jgi:non-ribosomal peptide synthase protein (TIGR01720 family)
MLFRKSGFEEHHIRKLFKKILTQHDALRMVYEFTEKSLNQINKGIDNAYCSLNTFDLRRNVKYQDEMLDICNTIQSSIDLAAGPLIKVALFNTDYGDHLLIAIHHLVVDGISWRILFEDFALGYTQLMKSQEIKLQSKTSSFRDWTMRLNEYSSSQKLLDELEYWKKVGSIPANPLPYKSEINERIVKNSRHVDMQMTREDTELLLKNTNHAFNTEINDILLTALGLTLKDWSKGDNILINLEGHGRSDMFKDIDISRTMGWFTVQYPVVLDMVNSEDLSYSIKSVKENLRRIPNRGIGYGILTYLTNENLKSDFNLFINPEVSFNYLGQFDEDILTDVFEISELPVGNCRGANCRNIYPLDINGVIKNKKLSISFTYDFNEYEDAIITRLANEYINNLQRIINYCNNIKDTEFTPSDYGTSDLSLEEFEEIMNNM